MTVKDNSDVTITGVTVDGRDQGGISSPPGAYNFSGVYVMNSDAHIDGIAVTNVRELNGGETSGNPNISSRPVSMIAIRHCSGSPSIPRL